MQNKRIIYPTDDGGVAIIIPSLDATEAQCISCVPVGKPYKIINAADVPSDRTFRNAWEYQA